MSYITEIFQRADIQQIREFLLHGVECVELDSRSYIKKINEERQPALDILSKKFPDMDKHEEITDKVFDYSSAVQDVYMEIGLRCGMTLAMQMLTESLEE